MIDGNPFEITKFDSDYASFDSNCLFSEKKEMMLL